MTTGQECADSRAARNTTLHRVSVPEADRRGCQREGLASGQATWPATDSGLMSTTAFAASSFAERVRAADR